MSKLHKRLTIIFCLGVLLCGTGAGVAFTEFSALAYGGKQILGNPDIRTKDIDVEFEVGEEKQKIWVVGMRSDISFQVDNSVPKDTVCFSATYNADRVIPFAYWSEEEGIVLSWSWENHDEVALIMEAKDVVLQNLKKGEIVSFDTLDIEKVIVRVNPENEDDVQMMY